MFLKRRVGIQIKALRERRRQTQAELAAQIRLSPDAISQIERGVSAPSFPTLENIARALNVPLRDFFEVVGTDDSAERITKLSIVMDIARSLSDRDLDVAIRQMEALGSRDQDS